MDISVADAADLLGISRRHANDLVTTGVLASRKLSGVYLVSSDSVHEYQRRRMPAGRPLSIPVAWAALYELSGVTPTWLTSRTRSRLHARLRDVSAGVLYRAVGSRSRTWRVHADGAAVQSELVASGRAAASVISSDLIEDLRRVDGYLRPSVRFEQLAQRFLLVEDPDGPDVIRENTSPVPLVEPLPAAVAADLALSLDPREADAGVTALEEMLHAFR
ncbi:hypothetical protein A0130_02735 [Leifsonia xyli]|uniref:helix-turn-helix domain-containing protein n=1 Tax=Leifsonia xyli TaxID=1575 RepID=UPI0007CDE3D7|nr:hypothetical protein A0130_02735 [Leifsonia xyli]